MDCLTLQLTNTPGWPWEASEGFAEHVQRCNTVYAQHCYEVGKATLLDYHNLYRKKSTVKGDPEMTRVSDHQSVRPEP